MYEHSGRVGEVSYKAYETSTRAYVYVGERMVGYLQSNDADRYDVFAVRNGIPVRLGGTVSTHQEGVVTLLAIDSPVVV